MSDASIQCDGSNCRKEGELIYCSAILCDDCRTRLMRSTGGRWNSDDNECVAKLASILKAPARKTVIDTYGLMRKDLLEANKMPTVPKKKITKKKPAAKKTTAKPVAKKTASKKRTKKVAQKNPLTEAQEALEKPETKPKVQKAQGTRKTKKGQITRREGAPRDDIAEELLKCDTTTEMIRYAKSLKDLDISIDKLLSVERAAKNGTSNGLIRMRLGNLIRGAVRRRDSPKKESPV